MYEHESHFSKDFPHKSVGLLIPRNLCFANSLVLPRMSTQIAAPANCCWSVVLRPAHTHAPFFAVPHFFLFLLL